MNWHLETKLRHDITYWDEMKESFLMPFNFADGFKCMDGVLQAIKAMIFQTPIEPINWMHPEWSAQLQHAMECYNVTRKKATRIHKISIFLRQKDCTRLQDLMQRSLIYHSW